MKPARAVEDMRFIWYPHLHGDNAASAAPADMII